MQYQMKNIIISALESNDLMSVVALVKDNRKVISQLIRVSYDKETLIGWRAIKAIGLGARELISNNYDFLRETIRKLLWSLSDESGGIGWSAPEILGEIVSADPFRFSDIPPLIADMYHIEEKYFRPGILYAFCRIAESNPSIMERYKDLIREGLSDNLPLARFYALELAMYVRAKLGDEFISDFKIQIESLKSDKMEVWVYKDNAFVNRQISEVASSILFNSGLDHT